MEDLWRNSKYAARIERALQIDGSEFVAERVQANCCGTLAFVAGIEDEVLSRYGAQRGVSNLKPNEALADTYDFVYFPADDRPGYIHPVAFADYLQRRVQSVKSPDAMFAIWDGSDFSHCGLYLGTQDGADIVFHQTQRGGRTVCQPLEEWFSEISRWAKFIEPVTIFYKT